MRHRGHDPLHERQGAHDLRTARRPWSAKNLFDCHGERSREIIRRLLADGGTNVYTIEKNGVRKMIYQTAWRVDGVVGGLAEISMEIPAEMPHYIRN